MKKILVLGMVVVMALGMFVGCGENNAGQVPQESQQQIQESQQNDNQAADQKSGDQQNQIVEDGVVMDPSEADLIGEEEAKKIALERVDGAVADDMKQFDLDYDDGMWVYEGEIYKGDYEYEFEINAGNGDIISWEKDHKYD